VSWAYAGSFVFGDQPAEDAVARDPVWVRSTPGRVVEELLPRARHDTARYANNRVGADHGQLKRRLRPMRGLKSDLGARTVITGHAFVQNIRRGFYELANDEPVQLRVAVAFTELTHAI